MEGLFFEINVSVKWNLSMGLLKWNLSMGLLFSSLHEAGRHQLPAWSRVLAFWKIHEVVCSPSKPEKVTYSSKNNKSLKLWNFLKSETNAWIKIKYPRFFCICWSTVSLIFVNWPRKGHGIGHGYSYSKMCRNSYKWLTCGHSLWKLHTWICA